MTQCHSTAQLLDPVDIPALEHLEDVSITHEDDPRNWTISFSFDRKNPFFSNKVLSKSFTVVPPAGSDAPAAAPYDLEADVFTSATSIDWTSDAHNLIKKAPKVSLPRSSCAKSCCGGADSSHGGEQINVDDLEENDDFNGSFGSFFNNFLSEGEDTESLSENLLEWYSHATEFAAGLIPLGESDSEFDEDEEDEESLDGEVDLEDSEEDEKPAKKKSKK